MQTSKNADKPSSTWISSKFVRVCVSVAALVLAAALAYLLHEGLAVSRAALASLDALSVAMDEGTSTLTVAAHGAVFSYPSDLALTLCSCELSLGARAVRLSLSGGSCATLSRASPRLDVEATAAPDGELAAALVRAAAGGGGFALACSASLLGGLLTRRVEVPLGAPGAAGTAPWCCSAAVGGERGPSLPPALVPVLHGFESTSAAIVLDAAALRAVLPFPLRALHVVLPGATLAVVEGWGGGASEVVASATLLPVAIHDEEGAGAAPALAALAFSPSAALSSAAPGLLVGVAATATGLPAEALLALLDSLGVRAPPALASAAAAAPASAAPTLTLRGRALPAGGDDAAAAAAVADLLGSSASGRCALDAAPLPWLRAALSGPDAPPCSDDTLLVVRVAVTSAGGELPPPAANAAPAPTVSIVLSTPGAGVDLSVPRATVAATLSLGNASFLARGLYTVLQPYVGVYAAPVSVDTHIPLDWRAATPAAALGAWNVGPQRATTLWASAACGQGSATLAWVGGSPASGVLVGSAVAELPNAVGCVRAVLREYGLGPFASTATGEALIRSTTAFAVPRGSVRLVLPAIGEVTLPLAVSTRAWLAGDVSVSPTQGLPVLSRPIHNASVWPGLFVVAEDAPGPAGLARAVGVASHSGEDTTAIAAGVAAGCAAGNGGFPVDCATWNALWRGAGFLGVDGILLAGDCPGGSDPLRVCASVSVVPGAFGVLNFKVSNRGGGGTTADLISAIAASAASPSGLAPARLTAQDNPWVSYDYAYVAGWELVPLEGDSTGTRWQGVALTGALLYANVVASPQFDGTGGWFNWGYNFSLPRVPSAACALPLPSRSSTAPSSTRGFNAITSEACARRAAQPLLDLGMDLYVGNAASGPSGGPLDWFSWGAGAPFQFFMYVWASASNYLTAYANVATPRSSWAETGIATAAGLIDQATRWAIALLTGASAGTALYPAVPAGVGFLTNNNNIAMEKFSITARATLQGSFLADVTFNSDEGGSASSSIKTADAAWAAA
jgi:hypothetical protein